MIAPLISTANRVRPAWSAGTRPVNSRRPVRIVLRPAKIDESPSQYREIRRSSRIGRRSVGRLSSAARADSAVVVWLVIERSWADRRRHDAVPQRYDARVTEPLRSRLTVVRWGTSRRSVAAGATNRKTDRSSEYIAVDARPMRPSRNVKTG